MGILSTRLYTQGFAREKSQLSSIVYSSKIGFNSFFFYLIYMVGQITLFMVT